MDKQQDIQQLTLDNPYVADPVHAYAYRSAGRLLLFDAGPPTAEAWAALDNKLEHARLDYIFLTHWHVDHAGLASRLAQQTGADILLSRAAANRIQPAPQRPAQLGELLQGLGFPAPLASGIAAEFVEITADLAPDLPHYRLLEESAELLASLGIGYRCCPWHSQGDVVYLCDRFAISGDLIIRGIFHAPLLDIDCTADDGRPFDSYTAFCQTLLTLAELEGHHFCPGHRQKLDSVRQWIQFAVRKLLARAAKLSAFYRQGKSVYQALQASGTNRSANAFTCFAAASGVAFDYAFLQQPQQLIDVLQQLQLYQQFQTDLSGLFGPDLAVCQNHPDRSAVLCCPRGRAFCAECREQEEMRSGVCGYCPHVGDSSCPIQKHYFSRNR